MDKKEARIVYLGTPEISASLLEALIEDGYNIVGVITQPDAPRGRNGKSLPSPVGEVAIRHNIPLHRPDRLNKDHSILDQWNPDLLLTYAYGQILSTKVLAYSKFAPLNVHASLLPRLRGASPIQTCLLEGDDKTGVCLMEMVKQMDAGRVFARKEIELSRKTNLTSLTEMVSNTAMELAKKYLPLYLDGKLEGELQDESKATFCHYITKNDMELGLDYPVDKFCNVARAFALKPGAFVKSKGGEQIKILECEPYVGMAKVERGLLTSLDKKTLLLGLGDGIIRINLIQRSGKKPCDASSFINGTGVGHAIFIEEKKED